MEFAYLSDITGDPTFTQLVEKIRTVIQERPRPKKLYPNYLNPKTGKWGQQHTSMGALGDSFYEYLLKEWLRSGKYNFWLIANLFVYKWTHLFYPFFPGKTDKIAKSMFDEAATDVENELVQTSNSGMTYFAEQKFGRLEHKMDHLACFGGMYLEWC